MILFTVSAILLLDTLAASAAIGVSSITWWCILGFLFFIPYGLISAELGPAYPEQGGIYAWVRDAFGTRWGTRVAWLYWLHTVLWNASIFVLFSGVFAQMFFPNLGLMAKLSIAIGLNWTVILLTTFSLRIGRWIPNLGALVKLFAFLALMLGGMAFATRGSTPLANDFSLAASIPEWRSSTQYISTIIYGMLGFELMSSASEEMKNPVRDVPRAILWSGIVIWLCYVCGTLAVLAAVPVGDINLVEGLVDTFRQLLGSSSLGVTASMVLGVLIAYGFMARDNEDLFWSLFAASAVLFILPFVGAVASFWRARRHDAQRSRPFRVPGGPSLAAGIAIVCRTLLLMTALLFMYVPGQGFDWPVFIGSLICILLGEVMIAWAERENRGARNA